jgi:plasmid maintenance system antidote protein VapI
MDKHNLSLGEAAKALSCSPTYITRVLNGSAKVTGKAKRMMNFYDRECKSPFMSST